MSDIFENYKLPITVYSDFEEQIMEEEENKIMCKIKTVVDVDKQELIKALNYDRNQYEAGYKAGVQQMRQQGKWKRRNMDIAEHPLHCTRCGWSNYHIDRYVESFKFCPECGATMDEVNKDENI